MPGRRPAGAARAQAAALRQQRVPRRRHHDDGVAWGRPCALCAAPDQRQPARAGGRRALRDVRGADSRRRTSMWWMWRAAPCCAPAGPCYLLFTDPHGPSALPVRAGALPLLPRTSGSVRASGTNWRSRSGWPSSSATPRRAGRSPSTRARPVPPNRSCPWAPGRRSRRPTPRLAVAAPDTEALLIRGAGTGPAAGRLPSGPHRRLL